MNFYPCNRHLLLDPLPKEDGNEKPTVLLPEGYATPRDEFVAYVVVSTAPDVSVSAYAGDIVVVEDHMVRKINFEGDIHHIVLENYVCGYLSNEEPTWEDEENQCN